MSTESWLYRQGDLILGPVPTNELVNKIYAGLVDAKTEVQIMGSGSFQPAGNLDAFRVHLAKAAAKSRVELEAVEHHKVQKKKTLTRVSVVGGVLVVLGIVLAVVGSYLAVHGGGGELEISIDPPTISAAKRAGDDELVEYNGPAGKKPAARPAGTTGTTGTTGSPAGTGTTGAVAAAKPPKGVKMGAADDEGLQMGEVDQAAINAVVAQYKPTLIPCIKEVAQPGVVARIPIEFTIAETGKVSKVWVDNPDFKDGALPACLLKELQKWPFKASPAGGASVQLSFNVGKRG